MVANMNALRAKSPPKEEEMCVIQLSETLTTHIFKLTSFISATDTRDIKEVEERNAR